VPVKQPKRRGAPPVTAVPVSSPLAVEGFLERHGLAIAVALVLFASIRIIATYTVFSHTYDEPAHIACGMEWLDKGVYRWEPQHPPLARVATALGPICWALDAITRQEWTALRCSKRALPSSIMATTTI